MKMCALECTECVLNRRVLLVMEESHPKLWYYWRHEEHYLFRNVEMC